MDLVNVLSKVRATELSPQAVLVLSIVNDNSSARYPMLFIGEVEGVYRSVVAKGKDTYPEEVRSWSYNGIASMLRKLAKQGYLTREVDGRYVVYGISDKGVKLLGKVVGANVDKRRRLKVVS